MSPQGLNSPHKDRYTSIKTHSLPPFICFSVGIPRPSPFLHHHHLMLQALALGPDTVDCSMETLASVWVHDPVDLSDLGEQRDESSPEWGESN